MNKGQAYRLRMVEQVLADAGIYPPHVAAPVVVAIVAAPVLPALDRHTLGRWIVTPATGEARRAGPNELDTTVKGWGLSPAGHGLAMRALTLTGWEGAPNV